ncbi:non-homologous end-joining DNA ligase [Jatrophihabitans telluris]|uniref:Non-homologous end-joining DNA ligase n=1 Tax=Jatrophihabitans telluris TaxID=2038343 RepID=A0ABY4R2J6_9ACTN|nr:non-homologous end-joining DNA ligase [Jatrophihabitans telluris]UQX90146.1 non-homologous end-joining DNA ligase [Jatrophihabitans telluris]
MSAQDDQQVVTVEGRQLVVRRLDKVLYPEAGTTKAQVLDYYARIAATMLPHLKDRPVTRLRWPDGTASKPFFEKNVPSHVPDWIRTVVLPTPGSSRDRETLTFPLIDDTAAIIWAANLAALELHVPQWTVGPRGGVHNPDRLVVDLDPGAPAGLAECAEVARLVRTELGDIGRFAIAVTSGSKGMQLYVPLSGEQNAGVVHTFARELADQLAADHRDLVVSKMAKTLRPGKVLLDWSQNNPAKTTICPYSMRGRAQPWVAAPRTWEELDDPGLAQLSITEVLDRVDRDGDLAAGLLKEGVRLGS